jgi:hypothetical protein
VKRLAIHLDGTWKTLNNNNVWRMAADQNVGVQ